MTNHHTQVGHGKSKVNHNFVRKPKDLSNTIGCTLCDSCDIISQDVHTNTATKGDGHGPSNEGTHSTGCFRCGGPHMISNCHCYKQRNSTEEYIESESGRQQQHMRTQDARLQEWIYLAFLAIPVSAPLKLGKGFIGNRIMIMINTLFDSGAKIMWVDRRTVPRSDYTGKYVHCRTFSCQVECFLQCQLTISMPYYTGLINLYVLRQPVAQLIVGQLSGVKYCMNQEITVWYRKNGIESKTILARCGERHHTHSSEEHSVEANAVTTRGATRKHQQLLQQEQNEKNRSLPQQKKRKLTQLSQPVKLCGIEEMDYRLHNTMPNELQIPTNAMDTPLEVNTPNSHHS